ncbi:MAG TPA: nuclear transport factor 2 family protein [Anaerolineales bacterium]|nr:nuclear transport factor 2 family protein [Anaerolineales bacterium]
MSIEETLLSLKEQALGATKNRDADFYDNYLTDNAIAIVPFGVFTKEAIVQQMASPNSAFRSTKVEDTRVILLSLISSPISNARLGG